MIARTIERWFGEHARELPWRPNGARDPYHALVSEAMLQQTQVSRVIEKYTAFLERFPTVQSLAAAHEDEVLALWSGLGYYRRAKNLHAAAKAVVSKFGGTFPRTAAELVRLPGVGRYTAGAVASMVFGERTPLVDGNVARVLLRIENRPRAQADPTDRATQAWVWERAGELVEASGKPGVFNEGLMELGATVCTPRSPRCGACPVAKVCEARAAGRQVQIPVPKAAARTRAIYCASVLVTARGGAEVLVEQRAGDGKGAAGTMWAGLWQAPTLEREDRPPTAAEVAGFIGVSESRVSLADSFVHKTTHRTVHFDVWEARAGRGRPRRGTWVARERVAQLGLSNPQRRILLGTPAGQSRLF